MHSGKIGFTEFVLVMALTTSMVALSIDMMLPALPEIAGYYGITRVNDQQFLITFLFIGLSIGQLISGPLSDNLGRKPTVYIGLGVFVLGSILSYCAATFEMMLAGRFVQGLGAAAPRVVSIAMVRDRYEGREMARVMSYIMGVFILVPALAPAAGLAVMALSGWRVIFLVFVAMSAILLVWISARLEETLHPEDKRPLTLPVVWNGVKTVCTNRMTACYTIAAGLSFGALMGYVNSAQQIFQEHYKTGDLFALYFGMCALALGLASFVNARIVRKYGMRQVILYSLAGLLSVAVLFIGAELVCGENGVPLAGFVVFMMFSSFFMGMCFGNFNALAMVPMGHMAGVASSVIGAVSLTVAIMMGGTIGQLYNGTLYPLSGGFLCSAILALGLMKLAEGKNFGKTPAPL